MTHTPELLVPVGSEECLNAAVENGADAVYFGIAGEKFNARTRAKNIPRDKIADVLFQLHRRGVKGYVALNTLVFDDELQEIAALVTEIAEAQADALIVQDLGLARFVRQICPELPMHASTQMSITSQRGIEFAQSLGMKRVVLPRELSLQQIETLCKNTDVELECFVHGSLCISFSGQCYASLGLGGRSANRGCCAQPCRLAYRMGQHNAQLLSPTDLCALPVLPQLVAAGVHSLKIEGRLKSPQYVAETTRIYREALDDISSGNPIVNVTEKIQRLELVYSRGFSTGWLEDIPPRRRVPGNITDHRGTLVGEVVEVRRDAAVVKIHSVVRRGDGILFESSSAPQTNPAGGRVYEIFQGGQSVQEAEISRGSAKVLLTFANDSLNVDAVQTGDLVRKTSDPKIEKEIRQTWESKQFKRRVPLDISVQAITGKPLAVDVQTPFGVAVHLRGDTVLESAKKHPLTVDVLREQFSRLGETIYALGTLNAHIEGEPMVPLSVLGSLRREMMERIEAEEQKQYRQQYQTSPKIQSVVLPVPVPEPPVPVSSPVTHLLIRQLHLLEDEMQREKILAQSKSLYIEMHDFAEYRSARDLIRKHNAELTLVLPRIIKPGESRVLKRLANLEPDAVLVRNFEELSFFREKEIPMIADFSFNAVNQLSFQQLLDWGVRRITPGWDASSAVQANIPEQYLEHIVQGRMPLFTMEHCLWKANIVKGSADCQRLCRTQPIQIVDRKGAVHSVRSDMFCRNTVERAEPAIVEPIPPHWQHLRVEWDG